MKKTIAGLAVLALISACAPVAPKGRGLPNPAPVFKAGEIGRADPEFSVVEFPEKDSEMVARPVYRIGHMMVTTRLAENRQMKDQAHAVKIYAADRELCSFMWWGSLKDRGFGWPFQPIAGDPEALRMDPASGITTYTKPYLDPDGRRAVFTYRLKPLGSSRVELDWDTGTAAGANLWVSFGTRYRGKRITVGGKAILENTFEDLQNKTAGFQSFDGGDLVYDASDPVNGFTLAMGDLSGAIVEGVTVHDKGQTPRFNLTYRTATRSGNAKGRVVIDLGEVEVMSRSLPPPVGGIEFWKDDATHVPVSPTRNAMHNPSFEQGLRGWTWIGGGAQYTPTNVPKYEVVPEGRFGTSALRMNRVQVEPGEEPTEFVCDPLDVNFVTSDPDNDLRPGDAMEAALTVVGRDGAGGKVDLQIRNAFREVLFEREFDVSIVSNGVARIPMNLATEQFGTGVFVVKATIAADGFPSYCDYYRFAIMTPLGNTHTTSRLMATLVGDAWRISRGEDLARKFMEWGWGGTSWMNILEMAQTNGCAVDLARRYRFVNAQTPTIDALWRTHDPKDTPWARVVRDFYDVPEITPEIVTYVEEKAYGILKQAPKDLLPYTAYGNEEESSKYPASGRFDEYFKLQSAVGRAARRAGIGCTPTSGTSGYNLLRGFEPYEGYLKAAHDKGFKYDALAVHPYGSIDKGSLSTSDLDDEAARRSGARARMSRTV